MGLLNAPRRFGELVALEAFGDARSVAVVAPIAARLGRNVLLPDRRKKRDATRVADNHEGAGSEP
jgi:hypothetical protein